MLRPPAVLAALLVLVAGLRPPLAAAAADVLVYGATPGGIAAAVAAAQAGRSVLLVEPTARIGGLVTSGLSHSDFHSFASLTGSFLDFSRRVEAHYAATYGPASPQVRDSFRGTFAEPKVNLAVFTALLAEHPRITVATGLTLAHVDLARPAGDAGPRIAAATFTRTPAGTRPAAGAAASPPAPLTHRARVFIDATYEGDLLAAAGVPWRAGREGRATYGESLAPPVGDTQLQAYNFRFIMTRDPALRVAPVAPPGYRREDFVPVLDALASGKIKKIFGYPSGCIFKAQTPPLPNV